MSNNTNTNNSNATGKGRRRRRLADEGEDGVLEDKDSQAATRPSECESEGEGPDIGSELSEYESAHESADQEEETEEGSETDTETGSESESGSDTETEGGDVYTDEEGLDQERQSGDGEEQPDSEKPDDDEDKKNPAYVPRRGAFYEHDFRQGDEGPEAEEEDPSKEPAKPVKKLWQEEGKWAHDRYIDDLQAPKTREELIAIYGYDIRTADKPPEAPPKRPGSGGGRGRRERKFQDFMPRMAVIDTTEDGADSVPNLGGENFIPYNSGSGRRGNNRSDSGRGRRGELRSGGGRGGYRNSNVESYNNNRNRQEGSGRFGHGGSQDARVSENSYPDTGGMSDYPSLQETAQFKERRDGQRQNAYDRLRRDEDFNGDRRDRRQGPPEPRRGGGSSRRGGYGDNQGPSESRRESGGGGHRRGGYGDSGDNRSIFSNSQDIRRDGENWRGTSHNYNQDRGGMRRTGTRQGDQGRASRDDNWRSSNDTKASFGKGDTFRQDQRENRYGADNSRNARVGNSGDFRAQSDRSGKYGPGQSFEQPPRHQQMPQEFTNTSLKSAEDRGAALQRGQGDVKHLDNAVAVNNSDLSKNVVVSSSHEKGQREKVQTINVTITSTTTEKKSYAKERRAKGVTLPEGGMLMGPADTKQAGTSLPPQSAHYQQQQQQHAKGANVEPGASGIQVQGKRYSSQRQQAIANRPYTEPPPATDGGGTKLYNPAMPPPPFYPRDQSSAAAASSVPPPSVQQPSLPPSVGVPDAARFTPTMLPPVTVPLQYPLPVSNAGLALPPSAGTAGTVSVNPALFQQAARPPPSQGNLPAPPPGTAIMAPPFLPAGMIYSGSPRVPPHNSAQAPPFPLPMAYTSPPPQAPVAPPAQGVAQQGNQSTSQPQHKVYRGDITYYAPELQQPPRAPQKRPKAAIPIIDPQVIREQKQKERQAQQEKVQSTQANPAVTNPNQSSDRSEVPSPALPQSDFSKEGPDHPVSVQKEGEHNSTLQEQRASGPATAKHEPNPVTEAEPGVENVKKTNADVEFGVKQELPEERQNAVEFKHSSTLDADMSSQPTAAAHENISIVAVDSRRPLTIVQSFKEPVEEMQKGIGCLELKNEVEENGNRVDVGEKEKTAGIECTVQPEVGSS
ncbi:protein casc3 [Plakobranchus ocellatus]|uniref:Protein CASC3 n=1 Tax=Plakobranchus ocellatus TaxID=259542 RepID=A0AAV3ZYZ0_9GAST|nr:protein casc3 [Plakobranchus ocellatus]